MTSFDTSAAIAQANKWTEAGAHLVRVLAEMDRAANALFHMQPDRAICEASDALTINYSQMTDMIGELRERFTESVMPPVPLDDDEAKWSTHTEQCEQINAAVISVGAFIKKMEMEA